MPPTGRCTDHYPAFRRILASKLRPLHEFVRFFTALGLGALFCLPVAFESHTHDFTPYLSRIALSLVAVDILGARLRFFEALRHPRVEGLIEPLVLSALSTKQAVAGFQAAAWGSGFGYTLGVVAVGYFFCFQTPVFFSGVLLVALLIRLTYADYATHVSLGTSWRSAEAIDISLCFAHSRLWLIAACVEPLFLWGCLMAITFLIDGAILIIVALLLAAAGEWWIRRPGTIHEDRPFEMAIRHELRLPPFDKASGNPRAQQ